MRSQNEERTQIFVIWSNYSGIDLYLWERRHPWRQACSRRQGWRRSQRYKSMPESAKSVVSA